MGAGLPYAAEQWAFGRTVGGDRVRREAVESAVSTMRSVWTGTVGGVGGFLRPHPQPPIILGGFGPKMAAVGRPGGRWDQRAGRSGSEQAARHRAHGACRGGTGRLALRRHGVLGSAEPARCNVSKSSDVDRVVVFLGAPSAARVQEMSPQPALTDGARPGRPSGPMRSAVDVVARVVPGEPPGEIFPGRLARRSSLIWSASTVVHGEFDNEIVGVKHVQRDAVAMIEHERHRLLVARRGEPILDLILRLLVHRQGNMAEG